MKLKEITLATTIGLIAGSSMLFIAHGSSDSSSASVKIFDEPVDFTTAAEQTTNGVVSIKSYATPRVSNRQQSQQDFIDPFFEYFFGPGYGQRQPRQQPQQAQPQERALGLGSGVIVSADGYIMTNNHVIDGADRLDVTLNDNRTFDAKVIGTDPSTDLALIKIEADELPVIKFGDSDALRVGEWVLAVGNPFGFTSTVTAGIVSAKARSISSVMQGMRGQMGIEAFIQTDAAVNPGNSGGALVNTRGELVGINTAIYSQTGNYAGHSFAIPSTIVQKVMGDLKAYGAVQRAVLGITTADLDSKLAQEKGITAVTSGMYVDNVVEGGAAAEAGIKGGDVIVALNDHPVHNFGELQEQLSKYSPGDAVNVKYVRENKTYTVKVNLRNSQGNTSITRAGSIDDLGAEFAKMSEEDLRKLNLRYGVKVKAVSKGKFRDAGIRTGFIITSINDAALEDPDDVAEIYKMIMKSDTSDQVMLIKGTYPNGRRDVYLVKLSD